jgi:hypothetical protein
MGRLATLIARLGNDSMRAQAGRLSSNHNTLNSSNEVAADRERTATRRGRAGRVDEDELRRRLAMLRTEHRDLDAAIQALSAAESRDQLQIARLKKRKLGLKDRIALIEDYLTPDIIA